MGALTNGIRASPCLSLINLINLPTQNHSSTTGTSVGMTPEPFDDGVDTESASNSDGYVQKKGRKRGSKPAATRIRYDNCSTCKAAGRSLTMPLGLSGLERWICSRPGKLTLGQPGSSMTGGSNLPLHPTQLPLGHQLFTPQPAQNASAI